MARYDALYGVTAIVLFALFNTLGFALFTSIHPIFQAIYIARGPLSTLAGSMKTPRNRPRTPSTAMPTMRK